MRGGAFSPPGWGCLSSAQPSVLYTQPSLSRLQPSVCVPGAACAPTTDQPSLSQSSLSLVWDLSHLSTGSLATGGVRGGRGAWGPLKASAATTCAHPPS